MNFLTSSKEGPAGFSMFSILSRIFATRASCVAIAPGVEGSESSTGSGEAMIKGEVCKR